MHILTLSKGEGLVGWLGDDNLDFGLDTKIEFRGDLGLGLIKVKQ